MYSYSNDLNKKYNLDHFSKIYIQCELYIIFLFHIKILKIWNVK